MKRKKYDPSRECTWCNPCTRSFCDCGTCDNKECKDCYPEVKDNKPASTSNSSDE